MILLNIEKKKIILFPFPFVPTTEGGFDVLNKHFSVLDAYPYWSLQTQLDVVLGTLSMLCHSQSHNDG